MIKTKTFILVLAIMLLINDLLLFTGYFYMMNKLDEEAPIETVEVTPDPEAEAKANANYFTIDECMGSYHMKGYSINGKQYVSRTPCDCNKVEDDMNE